MPIAELRTWKQLYARVRTLRDRFEIELATKDCEIADLTAEVAALTARIDELTKSTAKKEK